MKNLRGVWLLWKIVRTLDGLARLRDASASIQVTVEADGSYLKLCEEAAVRGLPPPRRRWGWEVSLWRDHNKPADYGRGATLAEAVASLHEVRVG